MNTSCIVEPIPLFKGERRAYSDIVQPFAEHTHSHYVFGIVREGERTLTLGGELLPIKKGSLIVFNPGDAHGCAQASPAPFSYDSITVAAQVLEGERFCRPNEGDALPRKLLEKVFLLLDGRCENEASGALIAFTQALARADGPHLNETEHERAAMRLYAHILGHLAERVCIGAFAESEGISPYALIRSYRRVFSLTPVQHQLALRVDAACGLLAKDTNVADAAAELGFSDQPHLTREFKKRIGCTPGAYAVMRKAGAYLQ